MANFQLQDNFKVPYSVIAVDKDNNPAVLAPGQTVSVVSDSPTSLSVVPDATPVAGSIASGFLVGGTTLKTGVNVTFSLLNADGSSAGTPVVDAIDVVAGAAASTSVTLGTPIPQ